MKPNKKGTEKNYLQKKRNKIKSKSIEDMIKEDITKIKLIKEIRENVNGTLITNSNIKELIAKDNTNLYVVNFYLKSLKNIDENKKNEIQFLKFVLPFQMQEEFVKKGYFNNEFDSKKELINLLNTFINEDEQEIEKYMYNKLEYFKSININGLYMYLLNYDFDCNQQLFLFHCFLLLIDSYKLNIIKKKYCCKNIFFDYIKNLTENKIFNKSEILYLLLILTYIEEIDKIRINKIFESTENKNNVIKILNNDYKNKVKINIQNKKITYQNNVYNFDDIYFTNFFEIITKFDKNEIDYFMKYYFYSFKNIQENNFFFFNKNMKNYYLEHLELFLISNLMKNCYYKYQYEYEYDNKIIKLEYLFEKKDSFKELKSHLYFFPFVPDRNILKDNISGLTNKQSLDVYIFIHPKLNLDIANKEKIFLLAYDILNAGFLMETLIYEVSGHYLYMYYYYNPIYGLKIEPGTPRNNKNKIFESFKNEIPNIQNYDEGILLEVCLFGDKISRLYFWGALYLLSSNLYNDFDNPDDLRKKFILFNKENPVEYPNINYEKSPIIKEIFKKYDIDPNNKISIDNTINNIPQNIYISIKDNNDFSIEFEHINDTIS